MCSLFKTLCACIHSSLTWKKEKKNGNRVKVLQYHLTIMIALFTMGTAIKMIGLAHSYNIIATPTNS